MPAFPFKTFILKSKFSIMKSIDRYYLFLLALIFSTFLFGQTTHVITLYVNTSEIDRQDVNSACNFGQGEGVSNEDFTVYVGPEDTVLWEGVSTVDNTEVNIRRIKFESGTKILYKNDIPGNGEQNEKVIGKVKSNIPGESMKYSIHFKVGNKMYKIDPKLQVGAGN